MKHSSKDLHGEAEFTALIEAVLNGQADDVQFAVLERRLQNDAAARDAYATYMNLHCELECRFAVEDDIVGLEAELEREFREEELANIRLTLPFGTTLRQRRRSVLGRVVSVTALAALVLGCVFVWSRWPVAVAVVHSADGARWEATSLAAGDELHAGQEIRLAAGIAEIRFASGAVVVLQGPATLQLDAARQASLHDGALSAVVPPQAVGFTVHAPGLEVVDLGTRFGLKTRPGRGAELHVFQGRAQASLVDGRGKSVQTVTLNKLEAAVIDPRQQTIARAESVLESFLFDDSLQQDFGRVIVQAEQFTDRSERHPDGNRWHTFQPPHDSFETASGNRFAQAVRAAGDDSIDSEEPGPGEIVVTSDGRPIAYDTFEGPWLSYDFDIRAEDDYQLWLLAAGHGDGPDGRADHVEAIISRYRNAAYRGSSALRPRAMKLNALVGMWQIGEEIPSPGSVTPFVIGSRFVDRPVPDGATRLFLGCHDFQQWCDNSGRVTANVVWSAEGSDGVGKIEVTVDSANCLPFAWATDEELGPETAGRGPFGEHSSSRPRSLPVPSTAQRMTITAEGIWSHIPQDELTGRLAFKLFALDDAGDAVELFSATDVHLPHGREFQWKPIESGGEPISLSAGSYRLRIFAQRPGSAIDRWLLQPASLPDPTALQE